MTAQRVSEEDQKRQVCRMLRSLAGKIQSGTIRMESADFDSRHSFHKQGDEFSLCHLTISYWAKVKPKHREKVPLS